MLTEKEKTIKETEKSYSNTPSGCYIHVYTGNGSGKTTSTLGVALRSLGHDRKVTIIQFLKGREDIGEFKVQDKLNNYNVYQFGRKTFIEKQNEEDKILDKQGLEKAKVLILDEINLAIYYNLLSTEEVIDFLKTAKAKDLDIYLTGRYCPKELIDYADFATNIQNLKRPDNFTARKGVEF